MSQNTLSFVVLRKPLLQYVQTYGRASAWTMACTFRQRSVLYILRHIVHWNGRFSLWKL